MAQTQIYIQKAQIHVIEETAQDTYLGPTGDNLNFFMAENVTVTYDEEVYQQQVRRADSLMMDDVKGVVSGSISFEVTMRGSGSAGTAPEYGEAIKACGIEDTTDATGGTTTYSPLSTFDGTGGNPGPSYSISVLEDGTRHAIGGAFGNMTLSAEVGQPGRLAFAYQGQYQAVAADGLESPTYDTTTPPAFLGASFSINFGGAYTPKGLRSISFDKGNQIALGRDANQATGIYGSRITMYRGSGSFDAEMVVPATFDYFGRARSATTGTITTGQVGSTAGNRWTFATTRSILGMPTLEEADGIRRVTVPFSAGSQTTDIEGTNHPWTLLFD